MNDFDYIIDDLDDDVAIFDPVDEDWDKAGGDEWQEWEGVEDCATW